MLRALWLCLVLICCAPACVTEPATPSTVPLNGPLLGWLEGCWFSDSTATVEVWRGYSNSHWFGHSVTTKNATVAFFEQLRIVQSDTGLVLSAYPRGVGPSDFFEIDRSNTSVTFVNPGHDFPQRIRYWRNDNQLQAEISLADGSNARRWQYNRCSSSK